MNHYCASGNGNSKSVGSCFDTLKLKLVPCLYNNDESEAKKNDDLEESSSVRSKSVFPRGLKSASCSMCCLGVLLFISPVMMFANENEEIERMGRLVGSGVVFIALGPVILLHVYIAKSYRSFIQKVFMVFGLGILYFFLINGFLMMIFGLQLFCKEFYLFYDPDIGFCDCDSRPLIETDESLVFTGDFSVSSGIRVASIGDIEASPSGRRVLNLVKKAEPDMLVINGDLTYIADPSALDAILRDIFPDDFPVFITVGNHDTGIYTEYQAVIKKRYERYLSLKREQGVPESEILLCEGSIGVDSICSFFNLGFVFSGIGSGCGTDKVLNENLESHLTRFEDDGLIWRTVFIHKNQRLLQTGGKRDEVGITAYEKSLEFGAIVMNSHEHSYARSFTLNNVGLSKRDFVFEEDQPRNRVTVGRNKLVVVANGLGGKSIRDPEDGLEKNSWWASTLHKKSRGVGFGMHLCEYGINERENEGQCIFQTIDEVIHDNYTLISLHGA